MKLTVKQELEAKLVEKDEIINEAKNKSKIVERQAIDSEKNTQEYKTKNEELGIRVRKFLKRQQVGILERESQKKDVKIVNLKNQLRVNP